MTAIVAGALQGMLLAAPASGGPATFPFVEDFESASLGPHWTTDSTGAGQIIIDDCYGPCHGFFHVLMRSATEGVYSLNELTLPCRGLQADRPG